MLFESENLKKFTSEVLQSVGLSSNDSYTVADNLVSANLRGVDSHGVARLPIYVKRIKAGVVNVAPNIQIVNESDATLLIDGDDGMGQVVGTAAMRIGIEKAKQNGAAYIGVKRSTHFGSASFFVLQGVKENMIAFAMSNAPSTMAPWGGFKPYFGTNPYAFGIPAGKHKPILLDMATSVVARGKILLAAQKGEPIPSGWAIDKQGRPTTIAQEALAGSVLPFGGPKGYAISLMIDIMSGILTGAGFGPHINNIYGDFDKPQNVGHFFHVIDIDRFMPRELFQQRIDQMIDEIKASPKAFGVEEIFLPGEIEFNIEQDRQLQGIPLGKEVFEDLRQLGKECGIDIQNYVSDRREANESFAADF